MTKFYYARTHEYIREEDGRFFLGISEYAAKELGDITYVELPEVGKNFKKGDVVATIESVKAVGECYAPVDLQITSLNEALRDKPELINTDPLGHGYICEVTVSDSAQLTSLMSPEEYEKMEKEAH